MALGARLMPKIPIIPPREYGDGGTGGGLEPLAPDMAEGLRALEARTARIDRELAVSQAWRAGVERLAGAENVPDGPPPDFTRSFLDDLDRERAQLLKPLPSGGQEALERDLLDLRADFLDRAADVEASGMALRRRSALYETLDGYRAGVTRAPGLFDRAAGRMERLVSEIALPDDRREPMRAYVKDALANAAVDGLMREPTRAAQILADGLFDDVLSEASKAQRMQEAQDRISRDEHLNRERTVVNLTAQARDGTASDE